MDNVNKTLYIPLYGKACVSRKGILLRDPMAEKIWAAEAFPLKGRSKSKWLAYYMAMRARVFDQWLAQQMERNPKAVIVHIGCGMDSRISRVGDRGHIWYDVDFPDVITERKRYFSETENYRMLSGDIREDAWLRGVPREDAIVIMEGVSMYLRPEELKETLRRIGTHFASVQLLMDCYSTLAAKASRYRNPINDVGVTQVFGLDDPCVLEKSGLKYAGAHNLTPADLIDELEGLEKLIFAKLYAGKTANRMYHLYQFST